jgi:hypothetical protein
MIVRFNGHLSKPYSVAEHSLLVADLARLMGENRRGQLAALLHDAHEVYTGDIARPIKMMVPKFAQYEEMMQTTVRDALGLPDELDPVWARVAQYDNALLHREMRVLRPVTPDWYDPGLDDEIPEQIRPAGYSWQQVKAMLEAELAHLDFKMPAVS